ncbi:hypothetical protein A2U01_0031001 [Trifolium medium]|uniref:Uncharacterized protein n=1 Tax=Trifolium medium TaxID=97028 RepID=A0A392PEL9_9FABA|nr:hypothetical protein [Trifolium medium]
MDAASLRAAAHRERVAVAKIKYDNDAQTRAIQFGSATFDVGNYDDLKEANKSMKQNHPGRVQKIFFTLNNNDRALKNLRTAALDMGNQDGYYVIFLTVNPDP